jgi:hypothetical protein
MELELTQSQKVTLFKPKTFDSASSFSTIVRDQRLPAYQTTPHMPLRVIVKYPHFTPIP